MHRTAIIVAGVVGVLALLLFLSDPTITGFSIGPAADSLEVRMNETIIDGSVRVPFNETMRIVSVSITASGIGADPYVRIGGREYPLEPRTNPLTGLFTGFVVAMRDTSEPLDPSRVVEQNSRSSARTRLVYGDGPYDIDNDGVAGRDDAVDFSVESDAVCVVWSVVSSSASLFCKGEGSCCREQGFPDPAEGDAASLVLTRESADGSVGRVLARAPDSSFSESLSFDFTGVSETYREFSGCGEACSIDHVARFIEIGTRSGRLDVDSIEIGYVSLSDRLVNESRIAYSMSDAESSAGASGTAPQPRVQVALAERLERGNRVRAIVRNESGTFVRELRRGEFDELVRSGSVTEAVIDQEVSVFTSDALSITNIASVQNEYGLSGDGVRVCIVDTGVDEGLFWREGVDYEGWNVLDSTSDFQDDHGHGTNVAYPLVRTAPEAQFIAIKALDDSGIGYESDVLKALDECESRGADVISLSIGSGLYDGLCDANVVAARVNELVSNGTLVVAAAGNEGGPLLKSPACASNATAVIASDDADALWSDSSYFERHAVLSAPGVSIETVDRFGDAVTASGTSMSTPFVSGAVALVLENASNTSPLDLRALLVGSGDPFNDSGFEYARLNVRNALEGVITNDLLGTGTQGNGTSGNVTTLTDITSCQTLSSSGTYTLTANVSNAGTCFTISSSDVTLDCNGYTVTHATSSPGTGVLINQGLDNVTVKSCTTIADATGADSSSHGVHFDGSSGNEITNATVRNVNATTRSTARAIYGYYSPGIVIEDSYGETFIAADSVVSAIEVRYAPGTIVNNTIGIANGTNQYTTGVMIRDSNRSIIENVTAYSYGAYGPAFWLIGDTNDTVVRDSTFVRDGSTNNGATIWMRDVGNVTLTNVNFSSTTSGAYGIALYYDVLGDLYVYNSTVSTPGADIYSQSASANLYLINTTYSTTSWNTGDTSPLYRGWYVDLYVNDSGGSPENSASISYADGGSFGSNPTPSGSGLVTAGSGYYRDLILYEYTEDDTGQTYFTNYTFNASKTSYSLDTLDWNLTDNVQLNFTISETPVVENVSLTSSDGGNTTAENLSVTYDSSDSDSSALYNTTDWRVNGTSLMRLNVPFNVNTSSLSTGSIIDLSTFNNDGTLGGGTGSEAPSWNDSCVVGGCYAFDGSDDVIDFGDPADGSLDFGNSSFSYGVWVHPTAHVGVYDVPLFKGGNSAGNAGYNLELGSGAWAAGISDGSTYVLASYPSGGPTNEWTYVIAVVDRETDNLSLYLNGSYAASNDISAVGNLSNSFDLTVGRKNTLSDQFQGYVDEVQVYSRALSAEEIAAIHSDQLAGRSIDTIVSNETVPGENWSVAVTSSDLYSYSTSVLSENLTILTDFDTPNVTLVNPATSWVVNSDPLLECRAESANTLVNVSLYTNASGWSAMNTTSVSGTNETVQLGTSGLTEGTYEWNCYACNGGQCAFASTNRTFTVDTTAPTLNYELPTPSDQETVSENSVYINISSSDTHNHSTFIDWNGSLVLWSAFDEYNSTHVFDRSAQSTNGTRTGSPVIIEGYYGKGLRFNVTDSITIPNVLS